MTVPVHAPKPLDEEAVQEVARLLGVRPLPGEDQAQFVRRVRSSLTQHPALVQAITTAVQNDASHRRTRFGTGLLWTLRIVLALAGLYSVV